MKRIKLNPLILAVAAVLAGHANGAIIASANFTGLTANNATTVAISGTAGVNGFAWTRVAGNTFTYSTPDVDMQSGTDNALTATIAGNTFQGMIGTMGSSTTIPIGQTLTLSFIGQYTEAPGNVGGGLRFGFISAYNNVNNANADNAIGVQSGTGTNNTLSLNRDTTPNFGPLGGTTVTMATTTGTQNVGTSVYTASFAITRTGTGTYSYSGNVNGSTVSVSGETVGVFDNYNAIAIVNGNTAADFRIDNVSVTLIPEPSAALIGSLGLLALLRRRA
jgi:hypothetical protein